MSYFDMINFDESTLLEGKQAEEYKARKAAEKEAKDKAEKDHYNRRYPSESGNDDRYAFRAIPGNQARHYKPFTDNKELAKRTDVIISYKPEDSNKIEKDRARHEKTNAFINKENDRRYEAANDAYEKYKNKRDEKLDFGPKPKFFGKKDYEKKVNELKIKHQNEVKNAKKEYRDKINKSTVGTMVDYDAVNRHFRRHSQAEACLEYTELALENYNPEYIDL